MAIRQGTIREAQEMGYEILGPTMVRPPEEPSGLDYAAIIGLEVVPAIVGGIWGGYPGAAGGGAFGNWLSQEYRIWRGLQEEVSGGELAAATAFSAIPGGKLVGLGGGARIAARATQGSAIALGELHARVALERGEMPSWNEIKATALFGGAFGGGLGAIEARMVGRVTKTNVEEGMNHGETVKTVADDIDSKGGYESYKDSAPEDLAAVLREMESKMAAPVTSSTRAAEGIVDTLGEMTATQLSRDLQALATKAPPRRPTIMGEDAAVTGAREMNDSEFAFHKLILSDDAFFRKAGLAKARQLEKEKSLHFEERGKLEELEAKRATLLHQKNHPDAPKDLPFKLKEVNRAITKIERKIEAVPKDLEKAIKKEQGETPQVEGPVDVINVSNEPVDVNSPEYLALRKKNIKQLERVMLNKKTTPEVRAMAKHVLEDRVEKGSKGAEGVLKKWKRILGKQILRSHPERVEERANKAYAKTFLADPEIFPFLKREASDISGEDLAPKAPAEFERPLLDVEIAELEKARKASKAEAEAPAETAYDDLTYREAQKQAKAAGVKAVGKHADIIKRLKKTAAPSLLLAGSGAAVVTDEDDEYMSRADPSSILWLLALGGVGLGLAARRFRKIREVKYLNRNPKARKEAIENIPRDKTTGQTRQEEVVAESMQEPGLYKDRGYWGEVLADAVQIVGEVITPMSRYIKNISLMVTRVLRDHEKDVSMKIAQYLTRVEPFVVSMTKAIGKNEADMRRLKIALFNGDDEMLKPLLDKYNNSIRTILRKDFKLDLGATAAHLQMRNALDDVRKYARERGGYDVGYLENYFPRQIKNYQAFRKFMTEHKGWRELQNEIDIEIQRYADRSYDGNVGIVPAAERAEIASRVLRGGTYARQAGPTNIKQRKIRLLDERMVDAYDDPAAAIKEYVSKVVTASERRHFLGYVDSPPPGREVTVDVGVTEVKDAMLNDLGLRADVEDAIGGYVERHSLKLGLSVDEAATLKRVVSARFNAKGTGAFIGAVKNANYLAVLGNFGAALTQLADPAYAIYFHGFGPTFKAMFGKHNRNWFKRFGLESKDIDMQSSRDGLSKLLHTTLKLVGFTDLDKFGKNVVMNAAFHRMRGEAISNPRKLMAELEPMYGKEITSQMIKDFKGGRFTDDVESVIWYKLLDVQPAALMEMPIGYAMGGNMRLAYMLKAFTIKQLDVFIHEAHKGQMGKAKDLWMKGKKEAAVKAAGIGVYNVAALATVFGAANAGTSVLKDTIFGREINPDELLNDTLLRLVGISRYNVWQIRREGLGKGALELFLPPTAFIDRASKDLMSLAEGEVSGEIFKGIGLGDFYYWHYGGGREKTRKAIAKKYGVKLENVPQ